jgi:serine O-acetyltransferase
MTRPAIRPTARTAWLSLRGLDDTPGQAAFWGQIRAAHPGFLHAVAADARLTARRRGERSTHRNRLDQAVQVLRLALVTESFLGQIAYRAKAALQARRIPLLPRLLHHLSVTRGQIVIGDPVVVEAGVFIPHGQVVIDGMTMIGAGTTISPFVTIGLRAGEFVGPTIGHRVEVGTGSRILGPWSIGDGARIGANAVVVSDVPAGATAVGVPARVGAPR